MIYLGYRRSRPDIVRAAIQEDMQAIGISSYNGGHIEFFAAVVDLFAQKRRRRYQSFRGRRRPHHARRRGNDERKGVDEIFFAGTSLDDMVKFVHRRYAETSNETAAPKIRRSGARAQTNSN